MTFDPKKLTQEERALWDAMAIQERRNRRVASESYSETEGAFRDLVKARRALFGEPASEKCVHKWKYQKCMKCGARVNPDPYGEIALPPETELPREIKEPASEGRKVECPNCGGDQRVGTHYVGWKQGGFTCKPAQPEPAANSAQAINARAEAAFAKATQPEPVTHEDAEFMRAGALAMARIIERDEQPEPVAAEMPEAEIPDDTLAHLIDRFSRKGHHPNILSALRELSRRRSQPAPAAVRMTEELREVLEFAANCHKDANTDTRVLWDPAYLVAVGKAIAAVRKSHT